MTLQFNCPNCNALMAFADRHAGKGARCSTCGRHLIIPRESFVKAKTLAEKPPESGEPMPGFYRAAFVEGWEVFLRRRNMVPLAFICAAVGFKFFFAHVDYSFVLMDRFAVNLPLGLVVRGTCWGCLFWYYLEIINDTVLGDDTRELPEIEIDGYAEFFGNAFRSLGAVAVALVVCLLPAILTNMLSGPKTHSLSARVLLNVGLFVFPLMLLAVGVNRDTGVLLRIDLLAVPLLKTFVPYLCVTLVITVLAQMQFRARNYGDSDLIHAVVRVKTGFFLAQLGIQALALLTMRGLGLIYRHYACYFRW